MLSLQQSRNLFRIAVSRLASQRDVIDCAVNTVPIPCEDLAREPIFGHRWDFIIVGYMQHALDFALCVAPVIQGLSGIRY